MSIMVQANISYPTPAALQALGLPTGTGSLSGIGVQRRNMADSLFKAVAGCRFTKVRFLLTSGVSANILNDVGQNLLVTALYIEDNDKRDRMFRYLLKRGVDCCHVDCTSGRDVITWASLLGRYAEVSQLMDAAIGEIDFTSTDIQGMTALHHATIQGHLEVVRLLVSVMDKYRLSVDITDKQGLTPFIYAKRLGYFSVAQVLLREGHCSSKQFDDDVHKSVDDWTEIGLTERRQFNKQQHRELLAHYKIRGQIPYNIVHNPVNRSRLHLPAITLSDPGTDSTHSMTILEQGASDWILDSEGNNTKVGGSSLRHGRAGRQQARTLQRSLHSGSKRQFGSSNRLVAFDQGNNASLPGIHDRRLPSPSPILQGTFNKSMDTAFALMDVQANQGSDIVHAAHFVHSQLDTSKVTESAGMMGDITSMMGILAEQQTGAFRVVAKPSTPPVVRSPPVPKKRNVSTLAILFGKDNTSRRYRPPAKGNKHRTKTPGQHSNGKKRKTTAKHKATCT